MAEAQATESKGSDKSSLLQEAKDRHKLCTDGWSDNRKAWLEDAKFRAGDQWPEDVKKLREDAKRPCVVVDKLNQYVRQVVNDGRQNRPGVKVRPEGDGAHEDVAEAFQDLIRGICARSNADEAFDTALDHSAGNGYGFFRVVTDYAHPGTFNQEIKILRVRNPRGVMLDPFIQAADGSDARFGFVEEDVPRDDYKAKYPEASFTDWVTDKSKYGDGWLTDKIVRVCEYWYKVETPTLVHLLGDGTTVPDEEYQAAVAEMQVEGEPPVPGPEIRESRELPTCKVKWCRMSGAEILEQKDWLGQYIPILMVIGNESDIDGKVTYSGLIRSAKDPQRLYNYSRSAYAERVALTPKAPFIAAEGQLEGYEDDWENANTENLAVLTYKPTTVGETPVPPPSRQQASDIPEGFARDMQLSEHDIQGAIGMYNSSLGEKSNEKSGKAIMARQREGDTGTFHYPDNLNRAIRYLGRILVDLIPKIYDSRRVVHLLGEDGTPDTAEINPDQQKPVEEYGGKKIYNLGIGIYGVDISAGPSYTTKRQEAVEAMMQLTQSAPEVMQIAGDVIVGNMDWPGADAIAKRMKMALPPPIQQAIQAEEEGQDPKVIAAVAPLQQQLQQQGQQIQAAEQGIAERDQALQKLQQEVDSLKSSKELDFAKIQLEHQKLAATQPDNAMEIRALELQHEDGWKKLDAETKVIVAQIGADKAAATAQIGAASSDATNAAPQDAPVEPPQVDMNQAILAAMQGFTEAIQGLRAPRTATLSDGRQIRIE